MHAFSAIGRNGSGSGQGTCGHVPGFAQDDVALINSEPVSHLVRNFVSAKDGPSQRRRRGLRLRRVEDIHEGVRAGLSKRLDPQMINARTEGNRRPGSPKDRPAIVRQGNGGQIAEATIALPQHPRIFACRGESPSQIDRWLRSNDRPIL